jgi:hypothetical protein
VAQLPYTLPPPEQPILNAIWLVVVCSFALVLLYAAYKIGAGVSVKLEKEALYATRGDTILTVFTTVVGFLAGLLSPSPVTKK